MARQKILLPEQSFVKKCSNKRNRTTHKIKLLPTQFVTLKCKKGKPRTVQVANTTAVVNTGTIIVRKHQKVKVTAIPGV